MGGTVEILQIDQVFYQDEAEEESVDHLDFDRNGPIFHVAL